MIGVAPKGIGRGSGQWLCGAMAMGSTEGAARAPSAAHLEGVAGVAPRVAPQPRYFFAIEAPSVYFGSTMLPRRTLPHIVSSI